MCNFNPASASFCKNFDGELRWSVKSFLVITSTLYMYTHTISNPLRTLYVFYWNISGLLQPPIGSFWYLVLEEYGPTIKYIYGPGSYIVDALSRLPLINSGITESNITRETLSESYCVNKLDVNTFPKTYQMIDKCQRREK